MVWIIYANSTKEGATVGLLLYYDSSITEEEEEYSCVNEADEEI